MKFIIVFVALFAIAVAAPPSSSADVTVLRSVSDVGPESFKYGYETSDGAKSDAEGTLKNAGTETEAIVVHGSYSHVGPDGIVYTVNYVADENGFQPTGAHLPVAPVA